MPTATAAENKLAETLQRKLGEQGLNLVARFEPAESEDVDDQIAFRTQDGAQEYPVVVQLSGRQAVVTVYTFDAEGQLDGHMQGRGHDSIGQKLVRELAEKLQANPPRPVADAPPPPGMGR